MARSRVWELISISLTVFVGGMYWGPLGALSKSTREFRTRSLVLVSVAGS
jgi:hypothetical protein